MFLQDFFWKGQLQQVASVYSSSSVPDWVLCLQAAPVDIHQKISLHAAPIEINYQFNSMVVN